MSKFKNVMQVFKLLEKTNCRKCNKPTCLAFAAAVFQVQVSLSKCSFVDEKTVKTYGDKNDKRKTGSEQDYQKAVSYLKEQIKQTDLESRAKILVQIKIFQLKPSIA